MVREENLRTRVRRLFDLGVQAADPAKAVSDALKKRPLEIPEGGRLIIAAFGKAACPMMEAALGAVPGGTNVRAIAITNYENRRKIDGCAVWGAAHPIPDENGLKAAEHLSDLVAKARPDDLVLCLISGGGSALVPAPRRGISLADKIEMNALMLANGLVIAETNLVRQNLSRLKGGGLAALAAPAGLRSLAVSDVIGDDPGTIASGPTAYPLGSTADAIKLLKERDLWAKTPQAVRGVLAKDQAVVGKECALRDLEVICSNRISLEAIRTALSGWQPRIVSAELSGDVSSAAKSIANEMRKRQDGARRALIWGGETTVTLRGNGKGGRNQELALRVAMSCADLAGDWVFLSGGTDGRDGPTDAAGGLVDRQTIARIAKAGGDPSGLLANNDSYKALALAGDLLRTGATGTNVADVAIFLQG